MKIYYEEKRIILNNFNFSDAIKIKGDFLQIRCNNMDELKQTLDDFFSDQLTSVLYLDADKNLFKSYFKLIKAAGGVVKKQNDILFIFRKEKWDLPKGKVDAGETTEQAALREVEEECGITDLKLVSDGCITYHIYFQSGIPILKETYWYNMSSKQEDNLKPQVEEDITKIKWVNSESLEDILENTYPLIKDVISAQS